MNTVVSLDTQSSDLERRLARFHRAREGILAEVRKVIVGQEEVLEQVLIALMIGGHCLITGLPGTAKTLMVRTIAKTLGKPVSGVAARAAHNRSGMVQTLERLKAAAESASAK